jgi:HPt (histidine-containing phosphotransfer) domain-containing protein
MKFCNLDYLKSVTPNSNSFPIKMINLFLQDTPDSIEKIKIALKSSNWIEVHKNARKIKPSVIMLGASKTLIDNLSHIIEFAKSEVETHQISTHLIDLEEDMSKLYFELEEAVKDMENQ